MIQPGSRVRILSPAYLAGETGTVVSAEQGETSSLTGYWLVLVDSRGFQVALLPEEMVEL